ncbi:MAG: DUF4389 domain-containing protein [Gemmatimonadetes bacterium]|nr:DUF4389 domain-containing protein [Gemmatimonadota bacterium]
MVEATMEGDELRTNGIDYPVAVRIEPQMEHRNRVTTFFRFFLALPHVILVGAPIALVTSAGWSSQDGGGWGWGSGGGVLSVVVAVGAVIAWLVIVLAGRHPDALWRLGAWYMRWRVRAAAYLTLLRDDYPPFADAPYPAALEVARPTEPRDRLTVFFRIALALPHLFLLWVLGIAWAVTTAVAWVVILFTGRYPETLYGFALGVLAWTARVECYLLLLRDEYPPFTLRV